MNVLVAVLALILAGALPAEPAAALQKRKKEADRNQFLIFVHVFTEQGFALPDAEIEIRRAGERKVAGRGRSDRRGEFAVRVPAGFEYDTTVKAKGFTEQTQKVDGRANWRQDVVFRMPPAPKGKKP
jgi:hypothetical protein